MLVKIELLLDSFSLESNLSLELSIFLSAGLFLESDLALIRPYYEIIGSKWAGD